MKKFLLIASIVGSLVFAQASAVLAARYESIPGTEVKGDFVLGPGKIELFMKPGDKVTREMVVTNRIGSAMKFRIEAEDFTGSDDPNTTVKLLGSERGPYSLKDFFQPEVNEFTLKQGERVVLPITISIPKDAEPGGRYGSVIVATAPVPESTATVGADQTQTQVATISRLATLFFVRVKGPAKEAGELERFGTSNKKKFFEAGPISFDVLYRNTGSVHAVPQGSVTITNIFGRTVGEVAVDPFFAMPGSVRARQVLWDRTSLFGRYTAVLELRRGFREAADIVDRQTVTFYVIPWKIILFALVGVIAIIWFIRTIATKFNFKIERKK